ncbi:MAG TPA: ABC transporter permease, partial [Thermomicrobiales bacterium]|nr:ABC transporter permease [Thermomicrobiales bacterium]
MISVFAAAWRVILKRTGADWLILAAATLIILLSTTLLAAGPIYAGAVTLSGLHRTLADAEVIEADVEISSRVRPDAYLALNDRIVSEAGAAFAPTGASVERMGRSDSFALPGQDEGEVTDLAVFGFFDNIQSHATLIEGSWPEGASSGPVAAVVSDSTAELLELSIGQEIELESRREAEFVVPAQIVGIYTINDPLDPYWFQEELEIGGIEVGQSFETYGPFVVSPEDFFGRTTYVSSDVYWRIFPTFPNLTVAEVGPFRENMDRLEGNLNAGVSSGQRFTVRTELNDILREAERSLLVTRTGVMILTVQLAVLAGYALVLTAGLLIEQRRVETALLRSRGASNGQIAAMASMEGLMLALPAAIAGPWIAAFSLRLLNVVGPLTAIDLELDPQVTTGAYLLSALSAAACVLALVLPAYLAARSFIDARASRGRQMLSGVAQRGGIDLALLVVAAIGYWQLRRYGAPITETVQGRLGLDPFLVAAPAIGLLAGAVVALRLIPMLAKLIERLVANGRSAVMSLGAWQVARRPLRYARSALLLMLALAIGLFAVSYTRTWTDSQRDQADYQVGADMRVTPDRRTGSAIPQYALANAYQQVAGIQEPMPVIRNTAVISRSAGTGRVMGVDALTAADVVMFRSDLAGASLESLMEELAERRPTVPLVEIPGEPLRLALDVELTLAELPAGASPEESQTISPSAWIVVQDGRGMIYRLPAGQLEPDSGVQRLIVDLTFDMGDRAATPQFPVSIVAVETRMLIPIEFPRAGRFDLAAVQASGSLDGDDWQRVELDRTPAGWQFSNSQLNGLLQAPT